jgi:hypothetical protein
MSIAGDISGTIRFNRPLSSSNFFELLQDHAICCSENRDVFMAFLSSPGLGDYEKNIALNGPVCG